MLWTTKCCLKFQDKNDQGLQRRVSKRLYFIWINLKRLEMLMFYLVKAFKNCYLMRGHTTAQVIPTKTLQLSSRQHRVLYWKRSSTLEISQHTPHPTSKHLSTHIPRYLDYFENKVKTIRESTKDAPVPDFSTLPPSVHLLCKFDEVTTAEVERLLSDSSIKQCELDSSVWL